MGRSVGGGARYLFYLPALGFFAVFLLLPLLAVVVLAFSAWTGFRVDTITFVGVANFEAAAADRVFHHALAHTVILVIATTVGLNVMGFGIALLLNARTTGSDFLRVAVLVPLAISPVMAGLLWQQILGPFGFLNTLLTFAGLDRIQFLAAPSALAAVVVVTIWQFSGYNALLYFAGLQSLPGDRVDAAAVDGAGRWSTVRHVVLPYMRPVVAVVVVLNLIGGWKVFDIVFVLTRGGPNRASEVLSTYLYEQAFNFSAVGYAATIAIVIVVLALLSTLLRGPLAGAPE